MKRQAFVALGMLLAMTVITGLAYPLLVTLTAKLLMPERADGSLITRDGRCIGSTLIGQSFIGKGYFHGRPSASGYMAMPSAASNAGPTSALLDGESDERRDSYRQAHALPGDLAVPVEMLFASGSGLDPHISPEAARNQQVLIARVRGIPPPVVDSLITAGTERRQWGFLGQPRLNVLLLNLALDARSERK
ncbi:potassium-transporting ATPase subunit KdpC [bacterium]|nr:potassium-transporting ATPase subunit KdpC [bacterium]